MSDRLLEFRILSDDEIDQMNRDVQRFIDPAIRNWWDRHDQAVAEQIARQQPSRSDHAHE